MTLHDTLFAAVYAEPDSDAPRAVLGDALLADGDPRGEFIQLQLARRRSKPSEARMRELLRAHAASWTGGLGHPGRCRFRRGFVAWVELAAMPSDEELDNPAWCTVEALQIGGPAPAPELARVLAHPHCRGVRELSNVDLDSLRELVGDRELERLSARAPFALLPRGLRVRELTLRAPFGPPGSSPPLEDSLAWFTALPQRDSVRMFAVDLHESALARAAAWLVGPSAPPTLARLALTPEFDYEHEPQAWQIELTRAGGTSVAVAATWHGKLRGERLPEGIGAALAAMPNGSIARFIARSAVFVQPETAEILNCELATGLAAHGLPAIRLQ